MTDTTGTYQPGDRVRYDDNRGTVIERIPSNRQGDADDYRVRWDEGIDGGVSIVWGSDLTPEDDVTWIRINDQVVAEVSFDRDDYMQGTDEIPGRLTGAVRMMRAAVDEGMFGLTADATSEGS